MLKKSGEVLKTSKHYLNTTIDNKQVGFSPEIKQFDDKGKEIVNIGHNKTFNKIRSKASSINKERKSFFSSFTRSKETEENDENDSNEENEVFEIDFSSTNEKLNDYYNTLKKSPYDNWCLTLNKFEIFSFLMGHTEFHNNKFSDYCAICSTKCELIEQTIICFHCFNFILLFELILNKMDDECIDEFLNGKNLAKANSIKEKKINNLRNLIYEEFGFLVNNLEKDKNTKFKLHRFKSNIIMNNPLKNNDNEKEKNENIIIEDNDNDNEINTTLKENNDLNGHKKIKSEEIMNMKKDFNEIQKENEINNSIIDISNNTNQSKEILVIKLIQRCSKCRRIRENAYFKYNIEKNIYKCLNCILCEAQKFFNEGVLYKTITKNILTNLTFHKEKNLF